jgi:hypothetical protein
MLLRDALWLAAAAVASHLLFVSLVPFAGSSLRSRRPGASSRSGSTASPLSTEDRLERLEHLLVTLDLRLEVMDERLKNIQLMSTAEPPAPQHAYASSTHPTKLRNMRDSGQRASRATAHGSESPAATPNSIMRATHPLRDAVLEPDPNQLGGQRGAATAADATETPEWLTNILQEMRRPASTPQQQSQEPQELLQPLRPPQTQQPSQTQQPRPAKPRQRITVSDGGNSVAGAAGAGAATTVSPATSATLGAGAVGGGGYRQATGETQRPAPPAVAADSSGRSAGASTPGAGSKQQPKRRRAPVKEEDWEEDWEKEDVAEKERAINPKPATERTSNLLEELQRLLSEQGGAANSKAAKKARGKKNKRGKVRSDASEATDGSDAEAATSSGAAQAAAAAGPETAASSGGSSSEGDDEDIVIEDVD